MHKKIFYIASSLCILHIAIQAQIGYNIYRGQGKAQKPTTTIKGDFTMKTKRIAKIDKKATIAKLNTNGYNDEYENDVILDILEKRSNEVFNKHQVEGVLLFYPNATYKKVDSHSFIFKTLA